MRIEVRNAQRRMRVSSRDVRNLLQRAHDEMRPGAAGHPTYRDRAELAVGIVSSRAMRRLNLAHTGRDDVTDVLAFDYGVESTPEEADPEEPPGGTGWSGEIVVCADRALERACEFGNTPGRELAVYLVHGLLHLLGMDDHDPADRERMRREESRLLDIAARGMDLEAAFGATSAGPKRSAP